MIGRKLRECVVEEGKGGREINGSEAQLLIQKMLNMGAFVSPEVWMELLGREKIEVEKNAVNASLVISLCFDNSLIGNKFLVEMYNYLTTVFQGKNEEVSAVTVYLIVCCCNCIAREAWIKLNERPSI